MTSTQERVATPVGPERLRGPGARPAAVRVGRPRDPRHPDRRDGRAADRSGDHLPRRRVRGLGDARHDPLPALLRRRRPRLRLPHHRADRREPDRQPGPQGARDASTKSSPRRRRPASRASTRTPPTSSRSTTRYPFAYERIAQLFDSPNAPDIVVNPKAYAFGRQPGQHGALDVDPVALAARLLRAGHQARRARPTRRRARSTSRRRSRISAASR